MERRRQTDDPPRGWASPALEAEVGYIARLAGAIKEGEVDERGLTRLLYRSERILEAMKGGGTPQWDTVAALAALARRYDPGYNPLCLLIALGWVSRTDVLGYALLAVPEPAQLADEMIRRAQMTETDADSLARRIAALADDWRRTMQPPDRPEGGTPRQPC